MPNTELLRNEFGNSENQHTIVGIARCRACCIFDVINKIVIKSKIGSYKTSERVVAIELISEMINTSFMKELILFDRGYTSSELISKLIESNIHFGEHT